MIHCKVDDDLDIVYHTHTHACTHTHTHTHLESSSPGGLGSPRHNGAESRGRSPTYTAFGPGPGLGDTRGHTHSAVGSTDSLPLAGGVVLRNKDGKKVVGGSAAVRRSRNFDKNGEYHSVCVWDCMFDISCCVTSLWVIFHTCGVYRLLYSYE